MIIDQRLPLRVVNDSMSECHLNPYTSFRGSIIVLVGKSTRLI